MANQPKSWVPRCRQDESSDWDTSPFRFATKSEASKEAHWAAVRNGAEDCEVTPSQEEPNARFTVKHGAVPFSEKTKTA